PVPAGCVFAASAHGRADLEHARRTGADCAVLGSVRSTPTHPGREPLGWEGFDAAAWEAGLPVYAIGGLGPAELPDAWAHRAQGVAGISAFWA
ncbi:MAG TPA: thiamine phosphate synthase, partial [Candidatus Binatia bacterium]|nr:thiamine phosphate synthase [Candidatus Binatia bacterium]